jgi:hypothetical protein
MIKEAMNRLLELRKPELLLLGGLPYTTGTVQPVYDPEPTTIACNTLTGLIELLSLPDVIPQTVFFLVPSHKTVLIESCGVGNFQRRISYAIASHVNNEFLYNQYMEIEQFNIGLQTFFVRDDTVESLLKITGKIVHEASITTNDDGCSQSVTIKTGIARLENVTAPNIIYLRPYRTFLEVDEQPKSMFVLRQRQTEKGGAEAGLFELDSGIWKIDAIQSIKAWLIDHITDKNIKIVG